MEVATFTEMISTMGFPIACVVAMFYMWNKEREEHKAECEKWVEAFNTNSAAIRDLKEMLNLIKEKIGNDKQQKD